MKKEEQPSVFKRLEQAYAWWEEAMWEAWVQFSWYSFSLVEETRSEFSSVNPNGFPFTGRAGLKNRLLGVLSKPDLSDLKQTCFPGMKREGTSENIEDRKPGWKARLFHSVMSGHLNFPFVLARWTQSSRRVYHLNEDLSLHLQTTSLKGLKLGDIKMPFDTFAIALEKPVEINGKLFDFILVQDLFSEGSIYLLSPELDKFHPISPILRSKVTDAVKKKKSTRILSLFKKNLKASSWEKYWDASISMGKPTSRDLNSDLEKEVSGRNKAWLDYMEAVSEIDKTLHDKLKTDNSEKLIRLVLGLTLYLQSFGDVIESLTTKRGKQPERPHTPCEEVLWDPNETLFVQSVVKLTEGEKKQFRDHLAGNREVSTHFREGYWRRPPGLGKDVFAKKTIWVRPTIVRRDRLPEGALPFGVAHSL